MAEVVDEIREPLVIDSCFLDDLNIFCRSFAKGAFFRQHQFFIVGANDVVLVSNTIFKMEIGWLDFGICLSGEASFCYCFTVNRFAKAMGFV